MRIIAGLAKGRTLTSVAGGTRPTSDRAREALFSSLTSEFGDFLGLHFLDVFAGSGAIGLEALSRGACLVHAVEKNEAACRTIQANYELVAKSKPAGIFLLQSMGVDRFLESPSHEVFDIVYIDPPYDYPDRDLYLCLQKLRENAFLKDGAVIAVERAYKADKRSTFTWPAGFTGVRERNYGQAVIYYGNLDENG